MIRYLYFSAAFCAFVPIVLLFIRQLSIRRLAILLYVFVILYLTAINRLIEIMLGLRSFDAVPQIDLTPFWSYAHFSQADIRWQVYMNVFLFIPFGFMLPWCSERLQRLWKVVLIAAMLSALTEAAQYFFCIGLCETDDVFHNTLGAVIGYGYWLLLCGAQTHFRGDRK